MLVTVEILIAGEHGLVIQDRRLDFNLQFIRARDPRIVRTRKVT